MPLWPKQTCNEPGSTSLSSSKVLPESWPYLLSDWFPWKDRPNRWRRLSPESWCSGTGHCGAGQLGSNRDKEEPVWKLDRYHLTPTGRGSGNGTERWSAKPGGAREANGQEETKLGKCSEHRIGTMVLGAWRGRVCLYTSCRYWTAIVILSSSSSSAPNSYWDLRRVRAPGLEIQIHLKQGLPV